MKRLDGPEAAGYRSNSPVATHMTVQAAVCHICGERNDEPGAWYCSGAHPLPQNADGALPTVWRWLREPNPVPNWLFALLWAGCLGNVIAIVLWWVTL
jgi:hypothetical protein